MSGSRGTYREALSKLNYKRSLRALQIELVKLQHHLISEGLKILVLFEGRDAAGKDGTIKRIVQHLSPRETRVVALGKPSDRDVSSWYFQRYVGHLPAAQEMVLMNRSWYNRAGVERVMGFCTDRQHEEFMQTVLAFETMLMRSGIKLIKYYLDISFREQERRLEKRRTDPLKQWKVSPIDDVALAHWDDYSAARNDMFERTHSEESPWYVVRADDKRGTHLNVIRHMLARIQFGGMNQDLARPDGEVVFPYDESRLGSGAIAP